jgi:hypothetical protein
VVETRVADLLDYPVIRALLDSASRPPVENWTWYEHLGRDAFRLALVDGRPVGALLAWPEVLPFAWVRLAVLESGTPVGLWLDSVLPPVRQALRRAGARVLGWMDVGGWAGPVLEARGFCSYTRLITLVKTDLQLPPLPTGAIRVRPGYPRDIPALVQVDRAAFTPPWWLSAETLRRMCGES